MRRTVQSDLSLGEAQLAINRFIFEILDENLPKTAYYQKLQGVIDQIVESERNGPAIDKIPLLVCKTNGGDICQAVPVTAAWQLLRQAAKLFDDVEDGDVHNHAAEAINVATGLLFVANLALDTLQSLEGSKYNSPSQAFSRAILRACAGQHADLAAAGQIDPTQIDPETWLEIAGAKSGELLAWAAWVGAWAAGVSEQVLTCYNRYGYHLGVLLQVADDFNGIWRPSDESDLSTGQPNLAVCYALSVIEAKERACLTQLVKLAVQGDSEAERQARQQLTGLGAQGYLLVVGRTQRQQAVMALQAAHENPLVYRQMTVLLDQVLPVVGYMFSETGMIQPQHYNGLMKSTDF